MRQPWYSQALVFSVLLHAMVLFILAVGFEFNAPMAVVENVNNGMKMISAVAIIAPEQQHPTFAAPSHRVTPAPEQLVQKPLPQQSILAVPTAAEVREAAQKQQAIALKAQRKKQLAIQKALMQKQLLADLKKQTVTAHKLKSPAIAQSMAKELREQAEKSLQQQLLQEQQRAAGAHTQGEVNKYKALILQAVGQRWLVPSGVDRTIIAELMIRLATDGTVLDVQVTKSSGDVALDRSARLAVFKASPLPVPDDAYAFNQFRQFVLKMKPENLQRGSFTPE